MDLLTFRKDFPTKRQFGTFSLEELNNYKSFFPDEIIDFLRQEGKSSYGNDLIWTVSPHDYHEVLKNWGLDGDQMFAIMRSSFGGVMYYYDEKVYIFNPIRGENYPFSDTFDGLINILLGMPLIQEGVFFKDQHDANYETLPKLKEDEMYTFVPAIPLGGDPENSKVEVVNMKVQLDFLAQLYDHTTTED